MKRLKEKRSQNCLYSYSVCPWQAHKEEQKQNKVFLSSDRSLTTVIGSLAVLKMSDNSCRPSETRWSSLNITQTQTHIIHLYKHIGSVTTQTIQHIPLVSINELWKPLKTPPIPPPCLNSLFSDSDEINKLQFIACPHQSSVLHCLKDQGLC